MRLKTPKPIRLIALAGIALFIGSCAKNTTIIYGSGEDDSLPETPQKGTTLVAFNASIESRNLFIKRWLETYAYHTDIHGWLFVCVFLFTCIIVILSVMRQVVVAAKINPAESVKSE